MAADQSPLTTRGGIYVAWHGNPLTGEDGEDTRRVWIARSEDDGVTFDKERPVSDPSTGVCGCCALRLAATRGRRAATAVSIGNRHGPSRHLFDGVSRPGPDVRGRTRSGMGDRRLPDDEHVHRGGNAGCCAPGKPTDRSTSIRRRQAIHRRRRRRPATSESMRRKHPRLAVNQQGTVLLAWTEGTAWARGGSLAWQAFGADGRPTAVKALAPGIPVWSFAAVLARPDGGFTIFLLKARATYATQTDSGLTGLRQTCRGRGALRTEM